ncbi:MAG: DUF1552 domain-containing protein [Myxococcota bacterium]
MTRTTRRRFLRAGASLTIGLPWLASLTRPARAEPGEFPRRVVFLIGSCGVVADDWFPDQTGTDFTLPYSLEPLQAYQDRMLVLKGLENASARNQSGNPHTKAGSHTLTGARHIPGQFNGGGGGGFSTRISIDQELAQQPGNTSPVASLLTGVNIGAGDNGETPRGRFSYLGHNMPVAPSGDPQQVFNQLSGFTGGSLPGEDPDAILRLRAERRSILDLAMDDIHELEPSLSAVDRQRLDHHLTHLRALEQSIANLPDPDDVSQACAEFDDPGSSDGIEDGTRKMLELTAFALRCDITRVATFQWAGAQSSLRYGFLEGVPDERHHGISHNDGNAYNTPMRQIARFHAEQTAVLADLLDAAPEGEGTLLDNTIIVHLNTLGRGNNHSFSDIPVLTVSGSGSGLDVGRSLQLQDRSLNDFYITLGRALGVNMTTFGDPEHVQGPIDTLLA